MVEVLQLVKRCSGSVAIDLFSFTVRPGVAAELLGLNGSVKSTATIGLMLGLDWRRCGRPLGNGSSSDEVLWPRQVGALWDAIATQ